MHTNSIERLILLLIKNLDEGDGASIPSIDRGFYRVLNSKNKGLDDISNLELLEFIDRVEKKGYILKNKKYNNYSITEDGLMYLSITNSSLDF